MHATFRPLTWSGPVTPAEKRRSRWTFKASWQNTLNLIDLELNYLGAAEVVIEADFTESDIRLDGMPRANAKQPAFPGVRIAFESKHGPLIYQSDACEFWQHNVRSIGLGLEALRAVDRYGITGRAEQYAGFKAISNVPFIQEFADVDEAVAWISAQAGDGLKQGVPIKTLIRIAARRTHPDTGGSAELFARYTAAIEVLEKAGLL